MTTSSPGNSWPVSLRRLVVLLGVFALVYSTFLFGFESGVVPLSRSGKHDPKPGGNAWDAVSSAVKARGSSDTPTRLGVQGEGSDLDVVYEAGTEAQTDVLATINQHGRPEELKRSDPNVIAEGHAFEKVEATVTPTDSSDPLLSGSAVTKSLDELREKAREILEKFARSHNRTSLSEEALNKTFHEDIFLEILQQEEVGTNYNSSEDESAASNITLNDAIKVVLHGRYRSGSTFSSEFFHRHAQTFYMYEPLKQGDNIYSSKQYTQQTIRNLFSCNLDPIYNYRGPQRPWIHRNVLCALPNQMAGCNVSHKVVPRQIAAENCKNSRLHVIKTIRTGYVNDLWYLMRKGVKVVQVIRDPRGAMFSRRALHIGIRKLPELSQEAGEYCRRAVSEIKFMRTRASEDPDIVKQTYYPVRYEDLATNATKEMYQLYDFIGIEPDASLIAWANITDIKSGTAGQAIRRLTPSRLYSTDRDNPEYTSRRWRYQLSFDIVTAVENVCGEYLTMFGYKFAGSSSLVRNESVSLLRSFSRESLLQLHPSV